ncbi:MAG: J domain-containing protein [Calditrichia bacterium]
MDARKDYYKILGVSENASQDEIKKAYRKLAKEYHPDKRAGDKAAEARFKEISEAYSVLNNPQKRQQYDALRRNPFAGSGQGGFNYEDFAPGGFRVHFGNADGMGGGFEDLIGNLFGFGRKRSSGSSFFDEDIFTRTRQSSPRRGVDIETEITIPFELAARGGETVVTTPLGKKVKLKIQPGIEDGKRMKISGQGSPAPAGGVPGDLYITVHVAPHPKFEKKGNDIYSTEEINLAQAVLGTEIQVETINGKKVKLKIPPESDGGTLFRLKGMGIQTPNGKGDHYVRLKITTPKNLNSQLKKSFKEWAEKAGLLTN